MNEKNDLGIVADAKLDTTSLSQPLRSDAPVITNGERTIACFDGLADTQSAAHISTPNVWLINWTRRGFGFGQITIHVNADGTLTVDDETMGEDFVKEVLGALVAEAFNVNK